MSSGHIQPQLAGPGVYRQMVKLSPGGLARWQWPTIEIIGENPGPRIAIWAGMHVNEVSGIEAAFRLARSLEPSVVHGRVSILPVLNLPALDQRTKLGCPVDKKNINFCFPGSPTGSFSEALTYALLNEWASTATCTFDLHGGDIDEDITQYVMIQLTGDEEFDAQLRTAADGFGATTRVEFPPHHMESPGRSITGRSAERKLAVMSEAGSNSRIDESDVAFHMRGVLGVAAKLGVVEANRVDMAEPRIPPTVVSEVLVVHSNVRGWGTPLKRPGEKVTRGEALVEVRDYASDGIRRILSPQRGHVMWTDHHPALERGQAVAGIGVS